MPVGRGLAPVHVALLALLGDRREVVAQLAGAAGEPGQRRAGAGVAVVLLVGRRLALGLGRARELLERGVEPEPRGLALGLLEQPGGQRHPHGVGAVRREQRGAQLREQRDAGALDRVDHVDAPRGRSTAASARARGARRGRARRACAVEIARAEVLGRDVLELVRLVEDHRVVIGQHARPGRARRAARGPRSRGGG